MRIRSKAIAVALAAAASVANWTPVQAHHSYAMFNFDKPYVVTGVVMRNNPDAFHYLMSIARLNPERTKVVRANNNPTVYIIEMDGAGAVNQLGINPDNFPAGTIVSVGFFTLRQGYGGTLNRFGLYKCPANTLPPAGKTCKDVPGGRLYGNGAGELPPNEPPLPGA